MDSKRSRVVVENDDESREESMATMKNLKTTHEAHISDRIAQQESGSGGLKVASTGTVPALLGQNFHDLPNTERRVSVGEMVQAAKKDSTYSEIRKQTRGSEREFEAEHRCDLVQEYSHHMSATDKESALDLPHSLSYHRQELSYDIREAVIGLLLLSQQASTQAERRKQGSLSEQEFDSEQEFNADIRDSNMLSVLAFPETNHHSANAWSNVEEDKKRQAAFELLQLSRDSATVLEVARRESFGFRVANTRTAPSLPSQPRRSHRLVKESGRSENGEDYHHASHLRQHSTEVLDINNDTVLVDSDSADYTASDDATIPDEDAISSDDENYVAVPV